MARQNTTPVPGHINMIGEGTVVEGTLRANNDIRVSGRIVGKVEVDGKVTVAENGAINGEIHAKNADIAGHVLGQLNIEERLVLKATARVDADIKTVRLVVEDGALFNGNCEMGQMSTVKTDKITRGSTAAATDPAEQQKKLATATTA